MKSDFNERRENRLARFEDLAIKNEQESTSRFKAAKSVGDMIPMGQPILVGHHSEGRHRSDLKRIDNNMRKSVEADRKSTYYANRAKHIERDNTIFSDDPEAVVKLKTKISGLEKNQELMKAANKVIKSKKFTENAKVEKLVDLGLTESQAMKIMEPDYCGRIGFASYALTNNNANISRNKKRLKVLIEANNAVTNEANFKSGIRLVDNVEDNRVQIFFPGKPDDDTRSDLKSKGFRWSPRIGCWQTHRSDWAVRKANDVISKFEGN